MGGIGGDEEKRLKTLRLSPFLYVYKSKQYYLLFKKVLRKTHLSYKQVGNRDSKSTSSVNKDTCNSMRERINYVNNISLTLAIAFRRCLTSPSCRL